jgi:stage III sporulation protein AF
VAFVTHWLKEIVLVVLIASFLEIVMPINGTHQFVKIALRLMLFLAILSPLGAIFTMKPAWINVQNTLLSQANTNENNSKRESVDVILQQGTALQTSRNTKIIETMKSHIEKQIKTQLSNSSKRYVLTVKVELNAYPSEQNKQNLTTLQIRHIQVVLGNKQTHKLVSPVWIHIAPMESNQHQTELEIEQMKWEKWLSRKWGDNQTITQVKIEQTDT